MTEVIALAAGGVALVALLAVLWLWFLLRRVRSAQLVLLGGGAALASRHLGRAQTA